MRSWCFCVEEIQKHLMTCKFEQHLDDTLFMRHIWDIVSHRHWWKRWVRAFWRAQYKCQNSTSEYAEVVNGSVLKIHIASQIFIFASKTFLKHWQVCISWNYYSMTHSPLSSFRNVISSGEQLIWSDEVTLKLAHVKHKMLCT